MVVLSWGADALGVVLGMARMQAPPLGLHRLRT
jgi:hypothetical protein